MNYNISIYLFLACIFSSCFLRPSYKKNEEIDKECRSYLYKNISDQLTNPDYGDSVAYYAIIAQQSKEKKHNLTLLCLKKDGKWTTYKSIGSAKAPCMKARESYLIPLVLYQGEPWGKSLIRTIDDFPENYIQSFRKKSLSDKTIIFETVTLINYKPVE
ncbi:hypothetical protein SAMN05444359_10232 [Neolewinella agarilytica]|uniref:Uncharacterized protein n=1 Tax=Neolewinella agarilytica TaxID=478744 RepID=A0A1H9AB50_9BACT|nr:hypothetical protein SAMN05444359_10232 [Neolewinella agarilytica]